MKKITAEITRAFLARKVKESGNSRTDGTALFLFGNKIAEWRPDGLWISNAGWKSNTTKERLNALPGVSIHQKDFAWFLNGKKWDGGWTFVQSPEVLIPRNEPAHPVGWQSV